MCNVCGHSVSTRTERAPAADIGQRRDILVVDDDHLIRRALTHILTQLGHVVFLAENGKEALDAMRVRTFDLLITDLFMPEMDGCLLAYVARRMSIRTPIILITGNDPHDVLPRVGHAPIDHIMFKPFGLAELKKVIDKFLPHDCFSNTTSAI